MTQATAPRILRFVPAYLALLLVLAVLGATNQNLLDHELTLMEQGETARRDVAAYRADAARIDGPLAVARWAQDNGMVPVPEVDAVQHLAPLPAPLPTTEDVRPQGLEVRTAWR